MKNTSPLPLYTDAVAEMLRGLPVMAARRVTINEAYGCTLRQDITADHDYPICDHAAIDGFAVRSHEIRPGATWSVLPPPEASDDRNAPLAPLPRQTAMMVAMSQPLPYGADAVIPFDQASSADVSLATTSQQLPQNSLHSYTASRVQGQSAARNGNLTSKDLTHVQFTIPQLQPGLNVRRKGSDLARGAVVLAAGTRLGPAQIAVACGVGATNLWVVDRPHVGAVIIARPPSQTSSNSQARNSNGGAVHHSAHDNPGLMLPCVLQSLGIRSIKQELAPDNPKAVITTTARVTADVQLTVLIGTAKQASWLSVACSQLGLNKIVDGVAIRPGGSVVIAADKQRVIFGLFGEPIDHLAAVHLYLWPGIRRMMGMESPEAAAQPWRRVRLGDSVATHPRHEALRLVRSVGDLVAEAVTSHEACDLTQASQANGWVRLPTGPDPAMRGSQIPFLPFLEH